MRKGFTICGGDLGVYIKPRPVYIAPCKCDPCVVSITLDRPERRPLELLHSTAIPGNSERKCMECRRPLPPTARENQGFCDRKCSGVFQGRRRVAQNKAEKDAERIVIASVSPRDRRGKFLQFTHAATTQPEKLRSFRNWQGYRKPITTQGTIRNAARVWVYVGERGLNLIKIGMSAVPIARCKNLGVTPVLALEVVPTAAKQVETEALRLLGHKVSDGEWVNATPEQGVSAVREAREIVGRYAHADPTLTAEEARLKRIGVLAA